MRNFKLLHGEKPTNKFYILASPGTTPTRRRGGWSDYNDFLALSQAGWLEQRATGPRDGKTWWPTRKGRYHLAKARSELARGAS